MKEDSVECHFYVEINAPRGLGGIEPHLVHCDLALEAWKSGYNDKVILRSRLASDFGWDMDSSDNALMFASGFIPTDAPAAEAKLRTLSTALRLGRFPHRILLDDPSERLFASIEHAWPPDSAPG